MTQTLSQLMADMQALRERLADGTARAHTGEVATGDVDAAIAALDNAIFALSGQTISTQQSSEPVVAHAPANPPYAIVDVEQGAPNNLTLIRGISSATAYALTNVGITRFAHIAGLTALDIDQLKTDLGYRCTISRDNWIEQAAILAKGDTTSFSRRGGPLGASSIETPSAQETVNNSDAALREPERDVVTDNDSDALVGSEIKTDVPAGPIAAEVPGELAQPAAQARTNSETIEGAVAHPLPMPECSISTDHASSNQSKIDPYAAGPFEELLPAPEPNASNVVLSEHESSSSTEALPIDVPTFEDITRGEDEHTITEALVATRAKADESFAPVPVSVDDTDYPLIVEKKPDALIDDDIFAVLPEPVAVLAAENNDLVTEPSELPTTVRVAPVVEPVFADTSATEMTEQADRSSETHEKPATDAALARDDVPWPQDITAPTEVKITPPPIDTSDGRISPTNSDPELSDMPVNGIIQEDESETGLEATGLGAMLASSEQETEDTPLSPFASVAAPSFTPSVTSQPSVQADIADAPFAPIIQDEYAPLGATNEAASVVSINVSEEDFSESENLRSELDEQFAPVLQTAPPPHVPVGDRLSPSPATIDPLPEPFSPHKTAVDEAEIVIVRDGETQAAELNIPKLAGRNNSSGLVGRISRMFGRKD